MVISGVFPFANGVKNGMLQMMMKRGKNEYFKLTPSSKSSDKNGADLILQDNESYFCSDTNTSKCSNFLIIELIDRAVYVNGYVIKSNDYGYLRSWKLYGSMGSDDWKELHSRELERFVYGTRHVPLNVNDEGQRGGLAEMLVERRPKSIFSTTAITQFSMKTIIP